MDAKTLADSTGVGRLTTERERYWRRRLGRIRLGVEPVDEQLTKYRRVTLTLSVVPGLIGLIIVTLFGAFGRPDVGLGLVLVVLGPMVGLAWLDYWKMARNVAAYRREIETLPSREGN